MLLDPITQKDHPECKSRADDGLSAITEIDPGYIKDHLSSDHPECKSRADDGLSAITELDPGYITDHLSSPPHPPLSLPAPALSASTSAPVFTIKISTSAASRLLKQQSKGRTTQHRRNGSVVGLPYQIGEGTYGCSRERSRRLQALSLQERKQILLDIASALEANEKVIKTANNVDVLAAGEARRVTS
ncbi:hypothetical protein ACFE04_004435 [Oxalis oulophora]